MMEFKEISEMEFDQFSRNYEDTNFWQSTNMAHLREWNGWSTKYVAVFENNKIKAATMLSYRKVFLGKTFVQAVRGFLIDFTNLELLDFFHKEIMIYLKQLNCMYFKVDPYLTRIERDINGDLVENGFNHEWIVEHFKKLGYHHTGYLRGDDIDREPNWMFVLDLKGKNKEQLLKEFDHQTRWTINKTLKLGIEVTPIDPNDLTIFKDMMEHTAERRGFADHSMHYYKGLFDCFEKQGNMLAFYAQLDVNAYENRLKEERNRIKSDLNIVETALAEVANSKKYNKKKRVLIEELEVNEKKLKEAQELKKDGDVLTLASATFILYGKEIMYLYSGAYDKYMRFNAAYAIQWHIIQYALEHGYERYNFYGISGYFERNQEGYGVYEFKRGFNGHVEELVGDFYYYLKPNLYRLYCSLRSLRNHLRK